MQLSMSYRQGVSICFALASWPEWTVRNVKNYPVRNLFFLRANNAYLYYFLPKPTDPQVNATLFEYVDVKNLSELRISIESLGDFDPAIFTAVHNYYYEDVAILMPSDQLLEGPDTDAGDDADDDTKKRQRLPDQPPATSVTPSSPGRP